MRHPRLTIYRARDGWRWRLQAANGRIIADSGEAYTRARDCDRAVTVMRETLRKMKLDVERA